MTAFGQKRTFKLEIDRLFLDELGAQHVNQGSKMRGRSVNQNHFIYFILKLYTHTFSVSSGVAI